MISNVIVRLIIDLYINQDESNKTLFLLVDIELLIDPCHWLPAKDEGFQMKQV